MCVVSVIYFFFWTEILIKNDVVVGSGKQMHLNKMQISGKISIIAEMWYLTLTQSIAVCRGRQQHIWNLNKYNPDRSYKRASNLGVRQLYLLERVRDGLAWENRSIIFVITSEGFVFLFLFNSKIKIALRSSSGYNWT